jgi:alpha-galactosidase
MIDASPFIALRHDQMAVLLEKVRGMAPMWRHWGAPVGDPPFLAADIAPPASFAPDGHWPLTVAPTDGDASYAQPIVRVHRDGRDFALRWDEVRADQGGDGSWHIILGDQLAMVELHQTLAMVGDSGTLALDTRVINIGDTPLSVDILASAILPLPADATTLLSFTGRHNAEFVEQREAMPSQQWVRDEARGMTGHAGPPGLFVLRGGADWHQGGVYAVQLAWSGNHRLSVTPRDDGGWTLAAGASLRSGEVTLAPGESHAAPTLLATYSQQGINGALWNFHRAVRARGPAITTARR